MGQVTFPTRPFKAAPSWSFLEGAAGRQVFDAYQARAKALGSPAVLNVLRLEGEVVVGSNPFAVVLIEDILQEQFPGYRVATPADLELALQSPSGGELRGRYADSGLVLRGIHAGQNQYLAQRLAGQLPKRIRLPVMIPLRYLTSAADEKSPHKAAFDLRKGVKPVYAPQFAPENNGKHFSKTDKNGLPVFDEQGTRVNYVSSAPLSGLFLGWSAGIDSNWGYLGSSDSGGRVVVVSGGATQKL